MSETPRFTPAHRDKLEKWRSAEFIGEAIDAALAEIDRLTTLLTATEQETLRIEQKMMEWCHEAQAARKQLADVLEAQQPIQPLVITKLRQELCRYLDGLSINGDNIGDIRRSIFVPWDSEWNGIVREETAARERAGEPERTP